jgi:sulfinoalanine decarboxylase / aspartate 1-decarboxylase
MGVPLQCSVFVIKEHGLLHACNSADADYLFMQDKFYDMSYDTGNKSVQCGRKVDAFKLWLLFKARGRIGLERAVDHAFAHIEFLRQQLKAHAGFRLLFDEWQYTNICFWYIPKRLRGQPETKEWWDQVYKNAPLIKEQMMKRGRLMVGYSPLPHKKLGNFFRMVLTCAPPATEESMMRVLEEIAEIGEIVG